MFDRPVRVRARSRLAEALARRRVPLGFAFAAVVLWLASPTPATVVLGAAIAAIGEAIRIWAAGHVKKGREVTASGPYRWTAHPLYVGSSVMGVGLAIASASIAAAALIALYLAATLTAAVKSEELFLRQAFGDRYDRYRRGTVEMPSGDDTASGVASRSVGRFSVGRAITNREYRALIGLVLVVLLLAWKATYNEPFWETAGTRTVRPGG